MGSSPLSPSGAPPQSKPGQVVPQPPGADRLSLLAQVEARAISVRPQPARRDAPARRALRQRILAEFQEMPGMCLTPPQAARLFGIQTDVSTRILEELVTEGLLRRRATGSYALPGATPFQRAG